MLRQLKIAAVLFAVLMLLSGCKVGKIYEMRENFSARWVSD